MTYALISVGSLAAGVSIVALVAGTILTLDSRRNRRLIEDIEAMRRTLRGPNRG